MNGIMYQKLNGESLTDAILRGIKHYVKMCNERPSICLVNPSMIAGEFHLSAVDGVEIAGRDYVLKGNLWIGHED